MTVMPIPEAGSHCSACGAAYAPAQPWPRQCAQCGAIAYRNPLPVAVLLQPVREQLPAGGERYGVVVIRRTVEPRAGWLALPGGFIEVGETWQEACAREACEEAGLDVNVATVSVVRVASTPLNLAVFGRGAPLELADLPPFAPNSEANERHVLFAAVELAFPLHSELLAETLAHFNKAAAHAPA